MEIAGGRLHALGQRPIAMTFRTMTSSTVLSEQFSTQHQIRRLTRRHAELPRLNHTRTQLAGQRRNFTAWRLGLDTCQQRVSLLLQRRLLRHFGQLLQQRNGLRGKLALLLVLLSIEYLAVLHELGIIHAYVIEHMHDGLRPLVISGRSGGRAMQADHKYEHCQPLNQQIRQKKRFGPVHRFISERPDLINPLL